MRRQQWMAAWEAAWQRNIEACDDEGDCMIVLT